MRRERFQIMLLVLGALFGYGYAFTHRPWHLHSYEHCSQTHGRDFGHGGHYDHDRPHAPDPEKPEN
jgi:hypothetical protein